MSELLARYRHLQRLAKAFMEHVGGSDDSYQSVSGLLMLWTVGCLTDQSNDS